MKKDEEELKDEELKMEDEEELGCLIDSLSSIVERPGEEKKERDEWMKEKKERTL